MDDSLAGAKARGASDFSTLPQVCAVGDDRIVGETLFEDCC